MDLLAKVIVILMYYFSVAHVGHSSSSAATPSQVLLPSFRSSMVADWLLPRVMQSVRKNLNTLDMSSPCCVITKALHKDIQFCFFPTNRAAEEIFCINFIEVQTPASVFPLIIKNTLWNVIILCTSCLDVQEQRSNQWAVFVLILQPSSQHPFGFCNINNEQRIVFSFTS